MDLIRTLRTVISSKVSEKLNATNITFKGAARDLLQKGLLSFSTFSMLYNCERNQVFSAERTWQLMTELGLACSLEERAGERFIQVPCLITDAMEQKVKMKAKVMEESQHSVCLDYTFDRNQSNQGMYYKMLSLFSKSFIWGDRGGDIALAFSQKVEERNLGSVSGAEGSLKWHTDGIQGPEDFQFLLLENEFTLPNHDMTEDPLSNVFAVHRAVRILLKPSKGILTKAVFEILLKVDRMFSVDLGPVQRSLACKQCSIEGENGFFELLEGLELRSDICDCSRLLHRPEEQTVKLIKEASKKKAFKLQSLMARKKRNTWL